MLETHRMETFVTCYVLVWVAVTLYVARLGARQRSLQQALNRLEQQGSESSFEHTPPARVA